MAGTFPPVLLKYFSTSGHNQLCSGLTPGAALRDHSWQGLGDLLGFWELNPSLLDSRQALYLLPIRGFLFLEYLAGRGILVFCLWAILGDAQGFFLALQEELLLAVLRTIWGARNRTQVSHV